MAVQAREAMSLRPPVQARHFVASSGHYLATAAAYRISVLGGNAVDAGVAAGICLNVLLPTQTNFGGVAPIMLYHKELNELRSISGVGYWGENASITYYRDELGEIPAGSLRSVLPGAPDAWLTALAMYGRLSFEQVAAPAIELCEQGFHVHPFLHHNIRELRDGIERWSSNREIFLPNGRTPKVGEILYQKDLGRTLRRLVTAERSSGRASRRSGIEAARDEFYRGEIAREVAEFVSKQGGFVTEGDLAGFASEVSEPPSIHYRGIDVYACGPWSQGPVNLQVLRLLDGFNLREMGHNSADYLSVLVQALDLAYSDREAYYGDPNFIDVPLKELISTEYAERQRQRIDPNSTFSEMPKPGDLQSFGIERGSIAPIKRFNNVPIEPDTSYVCVVDDEGNAFSATPSDGISDSPIIAGLGLICSGRGNQSRIEENHPAALQPGKRPRLTPNPLIAMKDGKVFMPFGTPGGDMQPQGMIQVFLNIVEFGMDPQQAVEQPRIGTYNHPDSRAPYVYHPGLRRVEGRVLEEVIAELKARGHRIERWPEWTQVAGRVCAIVVDSENGMKTGGADPRGDSYSIGW